MSPEALTSANQEPSPALVSGALLGLRIFNPRKSKTMFGKLLSSAIKIATLPVDAANAAADLVTGGDGSKRSRNHNPDFPNPLSFAEKLRDKVAEAAEDIDD